MVVVTVVVAGATIARTVYRGWSLIGWEDLSPPFSLCPVLVLVAQTQTSGRAGGIEAAIGQLRELGECRDIQESACWILALLSQVAEFSRR